MISKYLYAISTLSCSQSVGLLQFDTVVLSPYGDHHMQRAAGLLAINIHRTMVTAIESRTDVLTNYKDKTRTAI